MIQTDYKTDKKPMSLTYVGSFLDAEGCIVMGKIMKWNPRQQKRYSCTTIRMEICNTDFDIIKDIHKFMGIGHIIDIKPRITEKGTVTKPQKRWQTTHRQTYGVLKQILPYMKEKNKRKKAIEVINFYEKSEEL
tara:strand:+ start:557 stop:958 length:402 start_codon:yes stop_codon:yes gene_type:complete